MKVQLFKYWDALRTSFWFIPAIMVFGAVVLSAVAIQADHLAKGEGWLASGWVFTGGPDGANAVLSIIAGSMTTIAGVVFSMTLVVLSLASSQLGPRLLRSFMRDPPTQVVLGTFVATFLYCVLVVLTIRRGDEDAFVPHLSVTLGVLLAVISLGVLIYFIHHVAISIQANQVVARVGHELIDVLERLFPETIGQGPAGESASAPDAAFLRRFDREAEPVCSSGDGYLQFIDADALMALAVRDDVVVRLECHPGHYVVAGGPLLRVWPTGKRGDKLAREVNAAFALGNQRTSGQDIEFALYELVEIAVRALSPGINDPFTAIACVDRLGSALCRLATREMPSPYRHDSEGTLRVIAPSPSFPTMLDAAFDQIRQHGRTNVAVSIRLMETLVLITAFAHRPADRAAILQHAEMIRRGAWLSFAEQEDREALEKPYRAVKQALASPAP
ncbi:DUF2254 domain-containing protein [Guyparkeria sp. SCN-R1]|uniref:DUF2254 domain-containing protein n=1 Tax=Guyparkeria sp. SCN-R1 TaxID=2341113 RepID=UPI000F64D26A|nr:DUF2254 domain-containing protein [Guyparkeria sp. SCN-R1]RRQ24079.1 DUF2254 domain-containing protein [Guyparkeria sp. SCN-R1]